MCEATKASRSIFDNIISKANTPWWLYCEKALLSTGIASRHSSIHKSHVCLKKTSVAVVSESDSASK